MWLPTEKDIENYFLLSDMLEAQRKEFNPLSRKKSNEQLNPIKIKMVNRILEPLNKLFKNEASHKFLDILNEDDMPTNSDVVLVISQYETAINEFRKKYYFKDEYLLNEDAYPTWRWITKEKPSDYYKDNDIEDDL